MFGFAFGFQVASVQSAAANCGDLSHQLLAHVVSAAYVILIVAPRPYGWWYCKPLNLRFGQPRRLSTLQRPKSAVAPNAGSVETGPRSCLYPGLLFDHTSSTWRPATGTRRSGGSGSSPRSSWRPCANANRTRSAASCRCTRCRSGATSACSSRSVSGRLSSQTLSKV